MALRDFTPLVGTRAGMAFTLPPISRPDTSANPDIDKAGAALVPIPEGTGEYDSTGLNPFQWGSGQLNLVCMIYPAWSTTHGFADGSLGREQVQQLIEKSIYRGGSGYLTDVPPVGTTNMDTGAPILYYRAACKIYGQPKFEPTGIDTAKFTFTLYCPIGLWIASDNSTRSFGIISP